MGEQMEFPETFEEFLAKFSFTDKKALYTNGSELIPVFRVLQAVGHYFNHVTVKEALLAYMEGALNISKEHNDIIKKYYKEFTAIQATLSKDFIKKLTAEEAMSLVLSYRHVIFQYGCYATNVPIDKSISNIQSTPSSPTSVLRVDINSSEDN